MGNFRYGRRSCSMLVGVHPDLVAVMVRALALSDIDWAITEGVRALERQKLLLVQKRSRTLRSRHLKQRDGWSHAVDVMATGDLNGDGKRDHKDREITWDRDLYGRISKFVYQAAAELGVKVKWGGTFRNFFDGPHFQYEGKV